MQIRPVGTVPCGWADRHKATIVAVHLKSVACEGYATWPSQQSCDLNGLTERNIAMYAGGAQQYEGDAKGVDQCDSFPLP